MVLASMLTGCVLDRVLDTHDQMCKASPRQVLIAGGAGESLRVVFERPTLTPADVEWLVGLPPTDILASADGIRLQFAAAPVGRPMEDGATFVTELRFVAVSGEMRLAESIPPAQMVGLAPRELLDHMIAAACHPELSLAPPGARFDIRSLEATAFPDRRRIESIVGPPHDRDADGAFVYRFCLVPCDPLAPPIARLAYRMGPDGRLERGEFAYFRYRLIVDRPAGVATLALRL